MANTPKVFYEGRINTTGRVALYVVPANTTAMIGYITVCNVTSDAVVIDIGGGTNYDTHWFYDESVAKAGNELNPLEVRGPRVLEAANLIFVQADTADALDIYVDGWVKT